MQARSTGGSLSRAIDYVEETLIAILLGLMTIITFANVIARYLFDSNILWALEMTVFLFAWLVLLGASYGVKHSLHIGVDVLVNTLPAGVRKFLGLFAALCCIAFAALLLKGSWDYWYPFATERAWLETDDIPMPGFLQFIADWLNEGEQYEKIPRFIPYFVLPLSMTLLLLRFLIATGEILTGKRRQLIASHEGEDMYEDAAGVPHPDHSAAKD